jgi:hypothetical protein
MILMLTSWTRKQDVGSPDTDGVEAAGVAEGDHFFRSK